MSRLFRLRMRKFRSVVFICAYQDRAEKRLRMRAVNSFWRVFDPLNKVVLAGDFLAITTFDNLHERMETWRAKGNTTL